MAQTMRDQRLPSAGAGDFGGATAKRVVDIEVPVPITVVRISVLGVASGLGEEFWQMGLYSDARQIETGCFGLKLSL